MWQLFDKPANMWWLLKKLLRETFLGKADMDSKLAALDQYAQAAVL